MEPEQIVVVQESFEQLLPMADAVAAAFYGQLFAAAPELRPLFPADMEPQRHKLMAMLQAAVGGLWRPEDLMADLRELGARHVGYGTLPAHYKLVGTALIGALAESLGPAFSPEVEAAWRDAYAMIAESMLDGAVAT